MAVKASWKTNYQGTFIVGVPARSLSEEEFDALSPEDQERVRESGLYSMRGEEDPVPVAHSIPERKDDGSKPA